MARELRIAIAGAGQMGAAHAGAFRACGARVVAVSDVNAARAEQLAASHGARARQRPTWEKRREAADVWVSVGGMG